MIMGRFHPPPHNPWIAVLCAAGWLALSAAGQASEVLMKDGRILKGKLGDLVGLGDLPVMADTGDKVKQIVFLDDDLRRTFVPRRQIAEVVPDRAGQVDEKFNVSKRALRNGAMIKSVGPLIKVQPFDEFGRRIVTMNTVKGPLDVIQVITEITPEWTKVEGVNFTWDMRIATSSIPRDVLHKILLKQINLQNIEHRKKIARFYLQSERYEEAREALESILKEFQQDRQFTVIQQQLAPSIRSLRQLSAQKLLSELKLRRAAGQHQFVQKLLNEFPSDDVPGEILQAVREMIQEYEALEARRAKVIKDFDGLLLQMKDTAMRNSLAPIRKELAAELSIDTLGRMAAFLQNVEDAQMPAEDRLSLAISGWLLGPDAATPKLSLAVAAYRVRELARKYLNEAIKMSRVKWASSIRAEDATAAMMANLLAQMKPPLEMPRPVSDQTPGYYKLEVAAMTGEPPVTYYLQLPPEYNPHRRYPMIVTLHGGGTTAEQQVDWWAGAWARGARSGQAARHGYIVLSPEWSTENQKEYNYSAHEHAAVLASVRDACRRFAIDNDRMFLTGHSMGGDAAWDMGLAHPDLWAGVIPVSADSQKYCTFYWENARNLPFYVVLGELDGAKLSKNARDLDRYMKHGYNITVVEYLGRGHEHFYDEMLRLFDWMGRFHRDFFPREFKCTTMRPWDSFFWWMEADGLPPGAGTKGVRVEGTLMANNNISLRTGTNQVTVWLAPQMVDFQAHIAVVVNGRRINGSEPYVKPSVDTLLEDVRTRGDRQHPFWAKIEAPTGR
jgi:predicted esterase